jgi:uncharacterized protein with NRDE domain
MCLILFAHRADAALPLVVAANRDELHGRPTAAAHWWDDAPGILGGRDLEAGGTWMAVGADGRWAAVTNLRDPQRPRAAPASRGELVSGYLRGEVDPEAFSGDVAARYERYSGFNLLVGDRESVWYVGTRSPSPRLLDPGVYGLSNDVLDTPWPKVRDGAREVRALLDDRRPTTDELFEILLRTDPAPDTELPDTGVGRPLERVLSSRFIVGAEYGTRSSTVLLIDDGGSVRFEERSFLAGPVNSGIVRFEFELGRSAHRDTSSAPRSSASTGRSR